MGIFIKQGTWDKIKKTTLEDSIKKLRFLTENYDFQMGYTEIYIPFGYSAEFVPGEENKKSYKIGHINILGITWKKYLSSANFYKLYYYNNLNRISFGITINIDLDSKINIIKNPGYLYEIKGKKVLKLSKAMVNLELKTVKENLTDILIETQSILLKT